jgi:hypothetical protein
MDRIESLMERPWNHVGARRHRSRRHAERQEPRWQAQTPRSAAIVAAKKIIPIPLVTIHGLDPGFGGPHPVPAGLPRRTAIPPVPRRQRLEPKSVRPSPAPAHSGPPTATSALYWTREARLGLPIAWVRQRALLGARRPLAPLAKTQSPMRPRTPRRTRRSKRISLRSLSFVAGENVPGATH